MNVEELLKKEEGKTLEFKQDVSSLNGIIKTIVAFANTAGGTLVIGVEDKTKEIIGLKEPLDDEMRIANKIYTSVSPALTPTIDIQTYRKKSVILVHVPYMTGPFTFNKEGESTVYVRLGSTNREADADTITTMKLLARNMAFDENPCVYAPVDSFDWKAAEKYFAGVGKELTKTRAKGLGILTAYSGEDRLSNGGVLLFGTTKEEVFPDAIIRCVRFYGDTRSSQTLDHTEVSTHLPDAVDAVMHFIKKNTKVRSRIGNKPARIDTPQYPFAAVREAVINAIIHADYAIKGSSIIVAIFEDHIEITNPGGLPYGFSLEEALAGSSRCRNRVIAKTFHVLEIIEQWGSGLQKIIETCVEYGLEKPKFEETGTQFRVTIYAPEAPRTIVEQWQKDFIGHVLKFGGLGTNEAADFWGIDIRHARRRLKQMIDEGLVVKVGTSKNDPQGKYTVIKS